MSGAAGNQVDPMGGSGTQRGDGMDGGNGGGGYSARHIHRPVNRNCAILPTGTTGGEHGGQRRSGLRGEHHHPEVMLSILEQIVDAGDVLGIAGPGRTMLAVTVDSWLIDELAALGSDPADREPEDALLVWLLALLP